MAVFAASWSGARTALASRPRFYWTWYIGAAVIGAVSLLAPSSMTQPAKPGDFWVAAPAVFSIGCFAVIAAILVYFVMADTVRTFVPSFRMTFPVFVVQFVINMAYNAAVQLASYFLLIPAFYIGPKLWLWYPNYLLTVNGDNHDIVGALTRSWKETDGIYWPTLGLMVVVFAVGTVVLCAAILIAFLLVQLFNPLAIVTTPLLTFVAAYICAEIYHAWIGWAVAVGRYAESRPAPVPAAT